MNNAEHLICPGCKAELTIIDILQDPDIQPFSIEIDDTNQENLYYYFQHCIDTCFSTIKVPVEYFEPYINEAFPESNLYGTDLCEKRCNELGDMRICYKDCKWVPYRMFFRKIIFVKVYQDRSTDVIECFNELYTLHKILEPEVLEKY